MTSRRSDERAARPASGEPTLQRAQEQIDRLLNVSLNVAVTGESGAGKSTFINAFRNLGDEDEGAAETGVTETTTEPTPYTHPTMPNVTLWDLPGVGTPKFKAKTYAKAMKFDRYDFFLIISSRRFRENDLMLAKEIKQKKKQFYFIRSNIDIDIANEENKRGFNREETLSKIRRNCKENLSDVGDSKVFLINCRDLTAFDFEELVETLNSELPQHKQEALLLSVPVTSVAILEKKVKIVEKVILGAATVSGAIAAVPVPGLSFACDMAMVGSFFTTCYHIFGLDDKSLKKLSERVNKPHLKNLDKSPLLKELAQNSAARMGVSAVGEFLCSLIPGPGSIAAAAISFTTTRDLLQKGLKKLADEARRVLREAGLQ
ncbi:interferon-inducible GTPase 5-like [Pygocentrus nattereri]|uniref:IRG-type G domain-containing protein n=1 Tax=Pygocentrus nattereri TaxID=42514 RepID=A0A3B4DIH8_PYGNA|nr:interferon-inducible GTPase 5-like [Pygocentrus nattereri]XP_037401637.1 interferon-inducible GTPase 5-like [Pygocentrus nattereri]XP_037401638.1 interferon-inducible GTPase 5-like [Pygocentrus nattereri]XP_037401639.1 interferon-inducible GTPase 5-like [Pygocentrus nattereri]XP_037401640.1 interferon-inducible GTPase 5-like [Pygocentrus nattereri]